MTAAYIYMLLRLPWLAPDITTAIVNGRQPQQLSAKTLMRKASRLQPIGLNLARKVRFMRTHPYDLSSDASLRSRLQQKSTTKCPPRDFRRRLLRDTAHTSSLPQIGLACASRTGAKWRQNRCRQKSKNNHVINSLHVGWGARTRTWEWRNQNPLPYHLATPHPGGLLAPPSRAGP